MKGIKLIAFIMIPLFYGCLSVSSYNVNSLKIPPSFNEFRIVLVADLHSRNFGKNQDLLIERIVQQNPDIVVLAGDIISSKDRNVTNVRALLQGISGLCPVYAAAGNHEFDNPVLFPELIDVYREYGVVFLDGNTVEIKKADQVIALSSTKLYPKTKGVYWLADETTPLYKNEFNILLHHFGNEFNIISEEYDLVLAGHVHGGIIRIFGVGLLGNRNSPFFPKYTKGLYQKQSGSIMVLSAGLGNAGIPRINNPREIAVIVLKTE